MAPALWNLYFRERINLGASLRVQEFAEPKKMATDMEMAEAAVGIYTKLETGTLGREDGSDRTQVESYKSNIIISEIG